MREKGEENWGFTGSRRSVRIIEDDGKVTSRSEGISMRLLKIALAVVICAMASGCVIVDDGPPPPVPPGHLP
jgi:hypothetical protein